MININFLFDEEILDIQELSPGYEDHASDIWLVKTKNQEVIVRASRLHGRTDNEIWWGCKRIFGIDPRNVHEIENINSFLRKISSIPIPKVLKKAEFDRQFVVVEKLQGQTLQSFINQPSSVLQSLGEGLARIHSFKQSYIGNPAGSYKVSLADFHSHLINCIKEFVEEFYSLNQKIKEKLPEMIRVFEELPAPEYGSFVLVDLDSTQFLTDGKVLTGLVDTEGYVIAPSVFDFIGLEYLLDDQAAAEFKKGYEKVMPIPDIGPYRVPYRFLYLLLTVQGRVDLDEWLNQKHLF